MTRHKTCIALGAIGLALFLGTSTALAIFGMEWKAKAMRSQKESQQAREKFRESIGSGRAGGRFLLKAERYLLVESSWKPCQDLLEEAQTQILSALDTDPENPTLLSDAARAAFLLFRYPKALERWTQVVTLNPTSEAWFDLGLTHALILLRRSLVADKAPLSVQRCREAFETYALHYKFTDAVHVAFGMLWILKGETQRAEASLPDAIQLDATMSAAPLFWIHLLLETRQFDSALRTAQEAVSRFRFQPEFQALLGLARENLHQHQEAKEAYSAALELDPEFAEAYAARARVRRRAGEFDGADEDHRRAQSLDPTLK
jgi:tetratricopeptide (TPR) repeat protein